MSQFLAFGNNATGVLRPSVSDVGSDTFIREPTHVTHMIDGANVLWHTWTSTIIQTSSGLQYWGNVPERLDAALQLHTSPKLVGHDDIEGFLGQDGRLYDMQGGASSSTWVDVAVDGLGRVFTAESGAIYRYSSFESAVSGPHNFKITHPTLTKAIRLFALESRCFAATDSHLFEIDEDCLRLIEATEGSDSEVIPGRRNRLGIVTDAGDAYVLDAREKEPTPLELDDDVRLLGLGADFEVVVTGTRVLSRGSNQFGQLGRHGPQAEWGEIALQADKITTILCSRWATIVIMDDA